MKATNLQSSEGNAAVAYVVDNNRVYVTGIRPQGVTTYWAGHFISRICQDLGKKWFNLEFFDFMTPVTNPDHKDGYSVEQFILKIDQSSDGFAIVGKHQIEFSAGWNSGWPIPSTQKTVPQEVIDTLTPSFLKT